MLAGDLITTAQRRQTEAPKLIHAVRGDLDWIVMKCLEKDRTRRYETANGLAMDLQRHLNHEPVVARPPNRLYRFQKLVRRNTIAAAAIAVVTLVLVLGVAMSTWQAVRATLEADRATRAEREQTRLAGRAEAQEQATRRRAYAADMNVAYQSWEIGDAGWLRLRQFSRSVVRGVVLH